MTSGKIRRVCQTLDGWDAPGTLLSMLVFLVLGVIGLSLLLISLVFDGLLDMFEGDGLLSAPAIAAFITSLGFVGALASNAGAGPVVAALAGTVSGLGIGFLASLLARSAQNMKTDATPSSASYAGLIGSVVTAISDAGFGEVSLSVGGQPVKVSARADQAIPAGSTVKVVSVLSPTSVVVTLA